MKRTLLTVIASTLVLLAESSLHAQSTWNTTTGSWNTAANWLPAAVPTNATTTQLLFNASGTTSYTATNNVGAVTFSLNKITVNNTGTGTITLAAAAATNTLTLGGTTPTLDITGSTLVTARFIATAGTTVTKVGAGTLIYDNGTTSQGFLGTLNVNAGTFVYRDNGNAGNFMNQTSIVVNNGGTFQFGENGVGNPNFPDTTYITVNTGGTVKWQEAEQFGGFHLNGGTVNFEQGGSTNNGTTAQSWTSGTFTGGTFALGGSANFDKTTTGTVNITGGASITSTGTMNIQAGTIAMATASNLGTVPITLGNTAGATAGTFDYQGVTASRAGTFSVNAGGGSINVNNSAATLTLSGAFSGTGALSKTGTGTLALTGALGSTGSTTVSAGALKVEPVTAAGGFAISSGATLVANSAAGTASFTTPSLSFGSSTSLLQYDLNTATVTSAPLVNVTNGNGLTFTGTPTLKVTNPQPFANGTYTLIDYTGAGISSGFNVSLPGRTSGSLVYDTVNTKIDLSITGTDTVKWVGSVNNTWDVGSAANVGGTSNWQLVTAGTATNFFDTDNITFDDTATGFNVTLNSTAQPSVTTVNATSNYTLSGTGKISGTGVMNKAGSGTFIIATDNDNTGNTSITGGVLQVGNGGATGNLGTGTVDVAVGSTLKFNKTNSTTFGNVFSGAGNIEVNSGTVIQTGNSTFTGNVVINGGTMRLENPAGTHNFNAALITVNDTGTFVFGNAGAGNPNLPDTTFVTVNTGGIATFDEGENFGGVNLVGGNLNLLGTDGDISFVGVTASDFQSGTITRTGTKNIAGAGVINKTTSGTVTVTDAGLNNSGGLNIQEGTLATNAGIGATGTATLGTTTTTGTLSLTTTTTVTYAKALTLNNTSANGSIINVSNAAGAPVWSGAIGGAGALTKTGPGVLVLDGASSYTGGTFVNEGILRQGTTGNPDFLPHGIDSGTINVASGAAIELNGNSESSSAIAGAGTFRNGGTAAVTLSAGASNQSATFSGIIENGGTGTIGFTKVGSGTQTLSGSSTFTGNVAVSGGTLSVNAVASSSTPQPLGQGTSAVSLSGGGVLNYTGAATSWDRGVTVATGSGSVSNNGTGKLTLTGPISKNGTTLTLTGTQAIQVDGVISGALANSDLVVDGTHVTLANANTYNGPTSVINAGKLEVNNTAGSATGSGNVTVTGSTLMGTGRVSPAASGSVILGSAAIVSVGGAGDTSGKTLIFTPASGTMSTTFQSGSVVELDLFTGAGSGDNSGTGTSADALQWGGTLALQSNVKLRVNNPNTMTAFAEGDSWKVLDWTTFGGSAPSGTFEASLLELPTLTGLLGWDTSNLYTAGTLGIIAVPEPSRAVLMLGGLLAIVIRRRR